MSWGSFRTRMVARGLQFPGMMTRAKDTQCLRAYGRAAASVKVGVERNVNMISPPTTFKDQYDFSWPVTTVQLHFLFVRAMISFLLVVLYVRTVFSRPINQIPLDLLDNTNRTVTSSTLENRSKFLYQRCSNSGIGQRST